MRAYYRCLGIDGKEYIIRTDALRSGATKHIKNVGHKHKKIDLTGKKFYNVTVIEDTGIRDNQGHIKWHCKCDCGQEFDTYGTNLTSGQTTSCGCKRHSQWEEFIFDYLTMLNIKFEYQKRFPDCKNKNGTNLLSYDFYIYDYNLLIEYDGLHHFEPIKGWGGEEKFEVTKENDKIKNEYAFSHNIELLRIPYYKTKEDIINMINKYISPVTTTA